MGRSPPLPHLLRLAELRHSPTAPAHAGAVGSCAARFPATTWAWTPSTFSSHRLGGEPGAGHAARRISGANTSNIMKTSIASHKSMATAATGLATQSPAVWMAWPPASTGPAGGPSPRGAALVVVRTGDGVSTPDRRTCWKVTSCQRHNLARLQAGHHHELGFARCPPPSRGTGSSRSSASAASVGSTLVTTNLRRWSTTVDRRYSDRRSGSPFRRTGLDRSHPGARAHRLAAVSGEDGVPPCPPALHQGRAAGSPVAGSSAGPSR